MARSQSRESRRSRLAAMTRTQRAVIVAVGCRRHRGRRATRVTARTSRSRGAGSRSRSSFRRRVLLILDRVARPAGSGWRSRRLSPHSASGSRCRRSGRSARRRLCARSSAMLVYVPSRSRVALVLRRGDGPAVALERSSVSSRSRRYGLATRLFPDRFERFDDPFNTYRLAEPLGYWNALGLLATVGVLLASRTLSAHARRPAWALARGGGASGARRHAVLHVLARRMGGADGRRRSRGRPRSAKAPASVDGRRSGCALGRVRRIRDLARTR